MLFRTNWIPYLKSSCGAAHFLTNSFLFHGAHRVYRSFVPRMRNPGTVRNNYNQERIALANRLGQTDWESYVLFSQELRDFFVMDDKIKWGALREPRKILLQRLVDRVSAYTRPGQTIIEFGSGDGRNILYLQRMFPDRKFIGLELSKASVEVSYQAAEKFGIHGAQFFEANVCEPLPEMGIEGEVGLVYSSFALEQMPRIFKDALSNMISLRPHGVVLFEPIPELWGKGLRATVSRLRVHAIDRLRDVPEAIRKLRERHPEYRIAKMERSGIAINPHTEMCEVLLLKDASS